MFDRIAGHLVLSSSLMLPDLDLVSTLSHHLDRYSLHWLLLRKLSDLTDPEDWLVQIDSPNLLTNQIPVHISISYLDPIDLHLLDYLSLSRPSFTLYLALWLYLQL